ncbi:MAG: iron transporter substrate-binding protein [Frankiales bacterium]|nr:iron transporter substrate-binding protein [Frankiales bacterium]
MNRTSRRLLAGLATAALLATAACGSDDEPGEGASGSDALIVYSGRNETLIAPLIEQFTKATGIEVTPRYGGSAELAAQLLEEGDRTPADVFLSQDAGALGALEEAGGLETLPQTTLDRVPAKYRSAEGAWVGTSGRSRVLVYNPDLVPAASLPKSVFDLTGPAYKGKVGYAPTNASFQAFVTGMRVSAGEERTREFLTAFQANEPQSFEGNVAVLEAVDAGTIPFGLINHYYLYERAAEAGGLDQVTARNYLFPGTDPGSLVNVAGVGILDGKGSTDAQAFVDFLVSEQGQTFFAEQTKEYPLVAGVPVELEGLPPLEQLGGPDVDLSQLESLDETLALLDEVGLT